MSDGGNLEKAMMWWTPGVNLGGQAAMISRGNARLHTKVWAFALSAAQNRKPAERYLNNVFIVLFIVDDSL